MVAHQKKADISRLNYNDDGGDLCSLLWFHIDDVFCVLSHVVFCSKLLLIKMMMRWAQKVPTKNNTSISKIANLKIPELL